MPSLMSLTEAQEALWSFSLSRYAQPGVAAYCIEWQDCYQGHVNGLLAAAWCQYQGFTFEGRWRDWHDNLTQTALAKVEPLRRIRRAITDKTSLDYKQALSDELEAERQQQGQLLDFLFTTQSGLSADNQDSGSVLHDYASWHIAQFVRPTQQIQANALITRIGDAIFNAHQE